jgi:hypothetical protein
MNALAATPYVTDDDCCERSTQCSDKTIMNEDDEDVSGVFFM